MTQDRNEQNREMLNRLTRVIVIASLLWMTCDVIAAQESVASKKSVQQQHDHAVKLARDEKVDEGMAILRSLLDYPVRREYIVIATWKSDCDEALKHYKLVEKKSTQEEYLVIPVSNCFVQQGRSDKGLALLEKHLKKQPDNKELQDAYKKLKKDIEHATRPSYWISLGLSDSDAGSHDWFISAKYSQQLKYNSRWYLRQFITGSEDEEFATGRLNRLGFGIEYQINRQWALDTEMFAQVGSGQGSGYRVNVSNAVNNQLFIRGEYNSNSEDIPLRAKALEIETDRTMIAADYHTDGYIWEMSASLAHYDFSDSNDRTSFYGAAGYGYKMKARLEHRIIAEVSRSWNSQTGVVYYNPVRDLDISLVHRTSYVHKSKFDRHVDHLSVYVGNYNQEGYDAGQTFGLRLEQNYDFDDSLSLGWAIGWASRIYDGDRESITSFVISVSGRL